MKKTLLLILLPIVGFFSRGQAGHTSDCERISAIIATMSTWKKTHSPLPSTVLGPARKRTMHHPLLLGANRLYFSNAAKLPQEANSEWGIDDDGKCSFTASFGPYTTDLINTEGARMRRQWLTCIDRKDWQIRKDSGAYLFMSYDSVDVTVTILKTPAEKSGQYWLDVVLFRFTRIF